MRSASSTAAQAGDADAAARAEVLTPLAKAWGTDVGCEVASLGIQVHGGMGYIEETGAAQHLRDARIAPIYEGTNGIQAADLVGRKLGLDGGLAFDGLIADIRAEAQDPRLIALADAVEVAARDACATWRADDRQAGSYPFLTMCAVLVAGWLVERLAREPARCRRSRTQAAARLFPGGGGARSERAGGGGGSGGGDALRGAGGSAGLRRRQQERAWLRRVSRSQQVRRGRCRGWAMRARIAGHSLLDEAVALGVAQAGAGAGGDEHADAALDDDQPVVLEALIGLGDGQRVGALLGGEARGPRAAGRRRRSGRRGSRRRSLRAGGRKPACRELASKRHAVIIQQCATSRSSAWWAQRRTSVCERRRAGAPPARRPGEPRKMKPAIRSPGAQKAARTRFGIGRPAGDPAADKAQRMRRAAASSSPPRRPTIAAPTAGSCAPRSAPRRARPAPAPGARIRRALA